MTSHPPPVRSRSLALTFSLCCVLGGVPLLAACSDSASAPEDENASSSSDGPEDAGGEVQTVAADFDVPWGLAVLDSGDALVGERDSAAVWRVPADGEPEMLTTVPDVEPGGEGGLLGIVVPDGGDGEVFYAYLTTGTDNRVVEVNTTDTAPDEEPEVRLLLDGIPKAGNHNGGRLAFGPDGYLYVTTGDASDGQSAQDPETLAGKILRVTTDGDAAAGNPEEGSPIWSLGHRNVQGLGWDEEGRMWASEFGENDLDEVNLIEPGNNYGWPECEGPCSSGADSDFVDPALTWATSDASPSGLAVGPDGDLWVAALRGESLYRASTTAQDAIEGSERLYEGVYGRLRSVAFGNDDDLWVLTNNTSRGTPNEGDDKLLRIPLG